MLEVEVWRGTETGRFQTFAVPRREHQTVLDVVTEIQREQDATLVLPFRLPGRHVRLLRHGGERAPALDLPHAGIAGRRGRPAAARAVAQSHRGQGPRGRDDGVLRQVARRRRLFRSPARTRRDDFAVVPPATPARQAVDAGIECIGCGICYAACDVVGWERDYLGPAALNRAWTLVNDVRDTDNEARLAAVSGSGGCHACHTHMSCTSFCPKSLAPTYAIAGLKRAMVRRALRGNS